MTQTADLCIIGGGLLGTATAYFAARAGLKVILLEEKELASGASGAAFGGVSVGIYSYSSARVPASYVAISKASLELYSRLQEELGPPLDFYSPAALIRSTARTDWHAAANAPAGSMHVACRVSCWRPSKFARSNQLYRTSSAARSTVQSMAT